MATHMQIKNVIVYKRYVRDLLFNKNKLTVVYVGGRRECFKLLEEPTSSEIAAYEQELEDK